jgi:hypothetical protein
VVGQQAEKFLSCNLTTLNNQCPVFLPPFFHFGYGQLKTIAQTPPFCREMALRGAK